MHNHSDITQKQYAYRQAIWAYQQQAIFRYWHYAMVLLNQALCLSIVYLWCRQCLTMPAFAGLLLIGCWYAALYITDFINGVVHLIMDHAEGYTRPWGPLVAAFHLHHLTPKYNEKPLYQIYWHESGTKVWLVFYQLLILFLTHRFSVELHQSPAFLAYTGRVFFIPLSLWAEVSHYICHNRRISDQHVLVRLGLILSKAHHFKHHQQDNINYAFLNGWSDPLLNTIAKRTVKGYKNTTDLHYQLYKDEPLNML